MKDILERISYWKLAFVLCSIMYLSTCTSTFLAFSETWSDKTWEEMGWFSRTRSVVLSLASGIPTIIAFLNKTMARLEEGKPLVNPGDTRFVKREEVTTTTTTKQ